MRWKKQLIYLLLVNLSSLLLPGVYIQVKFLQYMYKMFLHCPSCLGGVVFVLHWKELGTSYRSTR